MSAPVQRDLEGLVVVVTGATGAAGPAVVQRLAASGAHVVATGRDQSRLDAVAAQAEGEVDTEVIDLLDESATREMADRLLAQRGRIDGLVHLVGGWRGGKGVVEADLADYAWLDDHVVRTLQHASRAFHDALRDSPRGRLAIVSTHQVERPGAKNASYAATKAAAEAWTLAVADSFSGSQSAAVILRIKALLTPAMREAKPEAKFNGYTPVADLARTIHDLWLTPADDLNGQRL